MELYGVTTKCWCMVICEYSANNAERIAFAPTYRYRCTHPYRGIYKYIYIYIYIGIGTVTGTATATSTSTDTHTNVIQNWQSHRSYFAVASPGCRGREIGLTSSATLMWLRRVWGLQRRGTSVTLKTLPRGKSPWCYKISQSFRRIRED